MTRTEAMQRGNAAILPDRLALLPTMILEEGAHYNLEAGACAMELVSWLADEPWSDSPLCTCPVIAGFVRSWNDTLPDAERTTLLRPLLPELIGTRGGEAVEHRRSLMCADWLVREHAAAWLRLAGLTKQADVLAGLPEITSMAQIPSIRPAIEAARDDAAAARAAAWAAAWTAARDAAWDAAWAAARDAAVAVAWGAAGAKLDPTKEALQQSAVALIRRMIAGAA